MPVARNVWFPIGAAMPAAAAVIGTVTPHSTTSTTRPMTGRACWISPAVTCGTNRTSVAAAAKTVRFTVKNTGKRAGTEIAQVYARPPRGAEDSFKRLAGWKRVTLAPGEAQTLTVPIDERVLRTFDEASESWKLNGGDYEVLVGASSDNTPLKASLPIR